MEKSDTTKSEDWLDRMKDFIPKDHHLKLAISEAHAHFMLPERIKPYHLLDVVCEDLHIWDKSPGLPLLQELNHHVKKLKDDPDAVASIRSYWSEVKRRKHPNPQDSQANIQSHIDYPMKMTIGEAQFAVPLISEYQAVGKTIAYGYETPIGMQKVHERFSASGRQYYSLNFKNFNETVPAWLIYKAFSVLYNQMDFTNYQKYGDPNPFRVDKQWVHIIEYFLHRASGSNGSNGGGIPSGSYFTNLISSICNYILLTWAVHKFTYAYIPDIVVFGEDSLFYLNKNVLLSCFSELFESIGMQLNTDKSQTSPDPSLIQFLDFQIKVYKTRADRVREKRENKKLRNKK